MRREHPIFFLKEVQGGQKTQTHPDLNPYKDMVQSYKTPRTGLIPSFL